MTSGRMQCAPAYARGEENTCCIGNEHLEETFDLNAPSPHLAGLFNKLAERRFDFPPAADCALVLNADKQGIEIAD